MIGRRHFPKGGPSREALVVERIALRCGVVRCAFGFVARYAALRLRFGSQLRECQVGERARSG